MLSVKDYIRTFVRKPSWFVHLVDCDYAHRQPSQVHSARDYFSTCAQKKWAPDGHPFVLCTGGKMLLVKVVLAGLVVAMVTAN